MNLKPAQAALVYDSVRETFSKNGVPTEEQGKAYITIARLDGRTEGKFARRGDIRFFPAAEAATELAVKK